MLKSIHLIGILACLVLVSSCFMSWAYYPDLKQHFTGFYSHRNNYGKPGKFLVLLSVLSMGCMLVPRLWAKRAHLFIAALLVGYAVKSYILFTSCYYGICPEKKPGVYLMLFSALLVLGASFLPANASLPERKDDGSPIR